MGYLAQKGCSSVLQLGLIFLLAILGVCMLVAGVFMTYKYGPNSHEQPLVLKLHSFSLSNLSVSNSLSTASWDTSFLFANQDSTFEIVIERYESLLFYINQSDALSCAPVEPIHLGTKRQKLVQIKFNSTACAGEQPYIGDHMLEEIRRDGEEGTLNFKLSMDLLVMYQRGLLGWHYHLKPDCGDLHVKFVAATGNGGLIGDGTKACLVSFPK
ncbi:hypothetical protein CFOL_v3_00859 [Cephalotus follicularis]|uniref:LEA_2 domain-containing protein n=1 Tax=Cephalotus follicularis TaxID=3775 RepID=A0A1Q3ANJ0_CEPFO|nr:hypothetical protein CFOL_v3_00859 [Cephalotus follicularis]